MPLRTKAKAKAEKQNERRQLPQNWPEDVLFVVDQTYSAAVTPDMVGALSRSAGESSSWTKIPVKEITAPSSLVEIQEIHEEKHPAHGERGLFASQNLDPDSFICLYLGHVHSNALADTDVQSDYDLSYDREIGLSIDSARIGNESRFANDFRGVAERPNAEFRDCFVRVQSKRANGEKWERRVGIFVLSAGQAGKRKAGIRAGEEILVSYGRGFWEGRKMMANLCTETSGLREE